jgi:anti-sigma-K factor RskA
MRRSGAGLHTLVGAYVMDAVPDADRAAFERHLTGCEPCREEVRGLREATARLATASAIEPRAELRAQTLLAAGRLRQLPPETGGRRSAGRTGRRRRRPGGAGLAGVFVRSWPVRITAAAAVVLAAAVVGLSLYMSAMQHRLSADDQRSHAIAAIIGAPDARRMTARVRTGGMATVIMSHRDGELVFTASKLSALPSSRAYELWLMGPAGATPAGMLPSARGGMTGPMVVGGLVPGDRLAVTVEPASGSQHPTTRPVVLVGL